MAALSALMAPSSGPITKEDRELIRQRKAEYEKGLAEERERRRKEYEERAEPLRQARLERKRAAWTKRNPT